MFGKQEGSQRARCDTLMRSLDRGKLITILRGLKRGMITILLQFCENIPSGTDTQIWQLYRISAYYNEGLHYRHEWQIGSSCTSAEGTSVRTDLQRVSMV